MKKAISSVSPAPKARGGFYDPLEYWDGQVYAAGEKVAEINEIQAGVEVSHTHAINSNGGSSYWGSNVQPVQPIQLYFPPANPPSSFTTTDPFPKEEPMEYTVGDGKTTSFTFQASTRYPHVRIFDRTVEGEGEEQTITLEEDLTAHLTIVQAETTTVTVTFASPPARRGAVVLF